MYAADVILIFQSFFYLPFFEISLQNHCNTYHRKFVNITEVKDYFDRKAWEVMVNWNPMFSQ